MIHKYAHMQKTSITKLQPNRSAMFTPESDISSDPELTVVNILFTKYHKTLNELAFSQKKKYNNS